MCCFNLLCTNYFQEDFLPQRKLIQQSGLVGGGLVIQRTKPCELSESNALVKVNSFTSIVDQAVEPFIGTCSFPQTVTFENFFFYFVHFHLFKKKNSLHLFCTPFIMYDSVDAHQAVHIYGLKSKTCMSLRRVGESKC